MLLVVCCLLCVMRCLWFVAWGLLSVVCVLVSLFVVCRPIGMLGGWYLGMFECWFVGLLICLSLFVV